MKFFAALRQLVGLFFPRMRVEGFEQSMRSASVFVCNHADSFGPLAMMLRFPARLHPWVTSVVMERGSCAAYVEADFVWKELHIRRPLSRVIALLIERVCVPMMRYLEAVPVYRHSRRILDTFELSRRFLDLGDSLLIFPELMGEPLNDLINRLDNGFLEVIRRAYLEGGLRAGIYPVYIDKARRRIVVGRRQEYYPERPFREERTRIGRELEAELSRLAAAGPFAAGLTVASDFASGAATSGEVGEDLPRKLGDL